MKSFKLILSLLSLAMLLTFSACGDDKKPEDTEDTTTEETTKDEEASTKTTTDKPKLEATADECGETMAKYIDLINKHTAVYEDYVENPDDEALQTKLDELNAAAKPLQKEIESKGQMFYADNYDSECWETYTQAVQRLSVGATKAVGKMLEDKAPEIQEAMDELGKQMENMNQ